MAEPQDTGLWNWSRCDVMRGMKKISWWNLFGVSVRLSVVLSHPCESNHWNWGEMRAKRKFFLIEERWTTKLCNAWNETTWKFNKSQCTNLFKSICSVNCPLLPFLKFNQTFAKHMSTILSNIKFLSQCIEITTFRMDEGIHVKNLVWASAQWSLQCSFAKMAATVKCWKHFTVTCMLTTQKILCLRCAVMLISAAIN